MPHNRRTNRLIVLPHIARTRLEDMTGMARFSRVAATTTALLLLHAFRGVEAQTRSVCEGELGEANWACDTLAPLPSQVCMHLPNHDRLAALRHAQVPLAVDVATSTAVHASMRITHSLHAQQTAYLHDSTAVYHTID